MIRCVQIKRPPYRLQRYESQYQNQRFRHQDTRFRRVSPEALPCRPRGYADRGCYKH